MNEMLLSKEEIEIIINSLKNENFSDKISLYSEQENFSYEYKKTKIEMRDRILIYLQSKIEGDYEK